MDHPLPTPIKSRRYSPTATLSPPSLFSLCCAVAPSPRIVFLSPRRFLPSFCFVFVAATWHKPPRRTGRPLPARDYCPSTRNQLTGYPVHAPLFFPLLVFTLPYSKRRRLTSSLVRSSRSKLLFFSSFSSIFLLGNRAPITELVFFRIVYLRDSENDKR